MLWVGTRRPWRGGLKNCALPFDRIGAFQYNFPKPTIFDSGVCEINARKKKRDKQPQSPPCPPLQCWMFSQATRTLQKRAFISQAHRPPLGAGSTTLRCGARGWSQTARAPVRAFISQTPDWRKRMLGIFKARVEACWHLVEMPGAMIVSK